MNLQSLRKNKKISQQKLADYLGVSRSTVAMWETSANEPDIHTIAKMAGFFGVPIAILLGVDEVRQTIGSVRVPVLGCVQAGIPIDAIEEIIDYEEIPESMAQNGEYYALQVKGDSMEPKMSSGDVVIVRKQDTVITGDIAIVLVNGHEATIKKVSITPTGIMLIPFNSAYVPIHYSPEEIETLPVRILGKVVELRAKYA